MLHFSNSLEHIVAVLGAMSIGAIAVPLSQDSGKHRVFSAFQDVNPRMCLRGPGITAPEELSESSVEMSIVDDRVSFNGSGPRPSPPSTTTKVAKLDAGWTLIRYSSGTTGQPKGVVLSQQQVLWTAQNLAQTFGLDRHHRELMVVSLAYSGGWQRAAATLCAGGCVILPEEPITLSGVLEDIQSWGVTGFFVPPPLLRMLLKLPAEKTQRSLGSCRSVEIGSAPASAAELRALLRLIPWSRIYYHYGLTECSRAFILDASARPDKLHTVGLPAAESSLSIRDETGKEVGNGLEGQVYLQGPQLMNCYWNRPELTAERLSDGWFATGDYGKVDDDGFLLLRGRRDDLINCGGHSFFPLEAEIELGPIEGVEQYLIVGMPDPTGVLGQVPCALVVPDDAETWTAQKFLKPARKRLPSHMVPRSVVVCPELLTTGSGKPDRKGTLRKFMQPKSAADAPPPDS